MSGLSGIVSELQHELATGDRSSLRYDICLPVLIVMDGHELYGVTENLSSSGALFRLSSRLPVDVEMAFLIDVPAEIIGSAGTAAIHGQGRVTRSYEENGQYYAAIVINEYRFQ